MQSLSHWMKVSFFCLVITCLLLTILINAISNTSTQHIIETNDYDSVEGWGFNISRDASQYISENASAILRPTGFCEAPTFLVVFVCSAPANLQNRNVIRATWGSDHVVAGKSMQVYFLMGEVANRTTQRQLEKESEMYNDIVQERFVDSYNNLTLKSIYMLKLVSTHCRHSTRFLMKTDDDMFVNAVPLIGMLNRNNSTGVLLGCLICHAKPIKDVNNKWYAPKYMYAGKVYPNYLSGTGYVMSIDVVPRLYEASFKKPIFYLEDIYITGILSRAIGLRPRNSAAFTFAKRSYDPCQFQTAITSHRLSPIEIQDQYTTLRYANLTADCHIYREQHSNNSTSLHSIVMRYFSQPKPRKKKKLICV